jgi:hypothetical protein
MHKSTKLTPVLREAVYKEWKSNKFSLRELGVRYHVDKKVISRIIERGKKGDFSVHSSINRRCLSKSSALAKGTLKKGKGRNK